MAALKQYQPGYRLIDGDQLNDMVSQVNNLTGNGTPGAVSASNFSQDGTLTQTPQVATAAGSNSQANSTLITKSVAIIATVSATTRGVRLPSAATGLTVRVMNNGATSARVWPFSGDRIAAAATNASTTLAKQVGRLYIAQNANTWAIA